MSEIKVLDYGFVRLVDVMGDDSSIVQAARVSYGGGTKTPEEDEKLIKYLMKMRHTSPFEQVEFKFHCKMPIFVARQWVRHRTASINEYSGRYSAIKDEYYIPKNIYRQSTTNKQGSGEEHAASPEMLKDIKNLCEKAFKLYNDMIIVGVAKEQARIILPLNCYTEWYWKIDLHNLLHFLKLRLDITAQYEIREYAKAIETIIKPIIPVTYKAFEKLILNKENL